MSAAITASAPLERESWILPDHMQLPFQDDSIVENFDQPAQTQLMTDPIVPWLKRMHPDGWYAIGQDSGIYWRLTNPPLEGCKAPDWFYVPDVPPLVNGERRRSYVLWQEIETPVVLLEFASRNGSEERDRTPWQGKFWVYERGIKSPYYGIFSLIDNSLEVFQLVGIRYKRMIPNENGRYPIVPLGLELGTWEGEYGGRPNRTWLRWFEPNGALLPTGHELAAAAHLIAESARQSAALAKQEADRSKQEADLAKQQAAIAEAQTATLAAKLRELGVDPQTL